MAHTCFPQHPGRGMHKAVTEQRMGVEKKSWAFPRVLMSLCTTSPVPIHCVSLIFLTRTRGFVHLIICFLFVFYFFPTLFFFFFCVCSCKRSFCSIYIYCGSSWRPYKDVGNLVCCDAQTGHYQSGINGLCAQYIQLFSDPQETPWVMAIIV